jgi:aminopeptidase N
MFGKIAGFEFRYQLRSPIFWIVVIAFFLATFGATSIDQIHLGDSSTVHRNSPYAIALDHMIWSVFFMFVTTAFVANVIVRDYETGFGPILRSTRVSKFDYLFGRFLGAFGACVLAFASVPLAILVGSYMPWLDPEVIGPFQANAYLYGFFVIALPNLLLTSAIFFALATVTRSMMATYVGVVVLFVVYLVAQLWINKPELEQISALLEPFGGAAYDLVTKYWTSTERNSLVPGFAGAMLWNRLLMIALSFGFLGLAGTLFRFDERSGKPSRKQKVRALAPPPAVVSAMPRLPRPAFGVATGLAQLWARTRLDMGQVFTSPAYLVLLVLALGNSLGQLWFASELYGTPIHPVTRVMIATLEGSFTFFPIIIAIYYAGELVWRERDRRTHEIIDATPMPDWAAALPKVVAIALVLISTLLVGAVAAAIVQLAKGDVALEPAKYVLWYILPNAIQCILIAILAVFLQAISPHKFVGWGLMVLYVVVFQFTLSNIGFEHVLYRYAHSLDVPLSDINDQGRFWIGRAWSQLYWSAFAVILFVLSYGLWRRGTESRFMPRLRRLPGRLNGVAGVIMACAFATFVGAGVYIFINTNIWNPYRTTQDNERWTADFEKALLKYETTPQPRIVSVRYDVQIFPHKPRVVTRGSYVLENRTKQPLREIHVRFGRDLEMRSIAIQGARPKLTYDRFNYRIFTFDTPMQPGERRSMAFETVLRQRGFRNSGDLLSVVDNGSFINDQDVAVGLGMDRNGLLKDRAKRHKYGLPRELRMPKLGTPGADAFNYLRHDSDWVTADIRVTTDADQTPIAPGEKVSETVANGRRTAVFHTESPIMNFFSVQSARYDVKSVPYKGVQISVYYDPHHPWNVDRMINAAKLSLDYFQANFSPYQFKQIRYLEFPDFQGQFAESFANTVPWSEGLGFLTDLPKQSDKIDYVTYVGAHEIGHQWWAHQVIGADEQGSTLLSETLAQYSALMVMKHTYGPTMIRKFLKYELDRYLRSRGGDPLPEQPLATVENQGYIHYRKGSLVMYRLQDEIGEDAVNRALRKVLAKFAFRPAPYPTSSDLISAIRSEAPADKQALITDLFEKITLYDVKTTKVTSKKRADGRFDVALTVSARKLYADGRGKETEAPMNEVLDVGLFDVEPATKGFAPGKVIAFQRMPIHTGVQTLHMVAGRAPKFGGADPYNKLIDRNSDDNVIPAAS